MRILALAPLFVCACSASDAPRPSSSLSFTDVTLASGIQLEHASWGTYGAAWGDYDGDGDVDLFVGRHGLLPALLRNTGQGSFVDVTRAAGLDAGIHAENYFLFDRHGCAWGDQDGDGSLDLYCATGGLGGIGSSPNQLFRNRHDGTFAELAAALGVEDGPGRGRGVNWIDYDKDGRLDLYVANARRSGHPTKLFQGAGAALQDVTAKAGLADEADVLSGGGTWCDTDGDGFTDLILATADGIVLHRNRRDGSFAADGASAAGIPSGSGRSVSCGDFDGDGSLDLFVASTTGPARLLRNRGDGTFTDATARAGVAVERAVAGVPADFDNDGDLDLFVVRGHDPASIRNLPDALFANAGDGTFTDVAASAGVAGPALGGGDAAAVADFDGDGFLDLFVTDGACQSDAPEGPIFAPFPAGLFPHGGVVRYPPAPQGAVTLFRNQGNGNHWLALRLSGRNRRGSVHGAQVSVRTGARGQSATLGDGVVGYGQSETLIHFGLGPERRVDEIRIRWPDGGQDRLENVPADQVLDLAQGAPP